MAIDVPIGLLERGARDCDLKARRLLGPRGSSVFPAPLRAILKAKSHREASSMRRRVEQKGISIQTWGIVPKIAEADRFLRADADRSRVVREAHPEVSFRFLNRGRPMALPKRKVAGRAERLAALRPWCGSAINRVLAESARLGCQKDDILDAIVLLWTAERIDRGIAIRLPDKTLFDACGLPMEISA